MTPSKSALGLHFSSPLKPQIDAALDVLLPNRQAQPEPLHRALRYAVFTSGKRMRPQFLLRVAQSCAANPADVDLALRAACALELLHIASLVHDDLPCFDNASHRRGHPTVHVLFGESLAVLVGDALLACSFEFLMDAPRSHAPRALRIGRELARAAGSSCGLCGSQGQEVCSLSASGTESPAAYHVAKTGALFGMAAASGAIAAGARKIDEWFRLGQLVGQGYQWVHALHDLARSNSVSQPELAPVPALAPPLRTNLQKQLSTISENVQRQVTSLAVHPEPLTDFLHALWSPLLLSPLRGENHASES